MPRFAELQKDRTLLHPGLPQNGRDAERGHAQDFTFVVTADTQFGMTTGNKDWEAEKKYSQEAVQQINAIEPRPLFCCVCGDLVHMTAELYANDNHTSRAECDAIQDAQIRDFKSIWSQVHEDIPLVCLCGNHDVGDRPTAVSIERFRQNFGDEYLAFWAKSTYNIVLNTALFKNSSGAPEMFDIQLQWLIGRLQYAKHNNASHIFVFGHHPWFLYDENDDSENGTLPGETPLAEFGMEGSIPDAYFIIPIDMRKKVLRLFQQYGVTAAFAGHFHQNMVSQTSFGMQMITTSSLSVILKSTGVPKTFDEPKTRGMRIVKVAKDGAFRHHFVSL